MDTQVLAVGMNLQSSGIWPRWQRLVEEWREGVSESDHCLKVKEKDGDADFLYTGMMTWSMVVIDWSSEGEMVRSRQSTVERAGERARERCAGKRRWKKEEE